MSLLRRLLNICRRLVRCPKSDGPERTREERRRSAFFEGPWVHGEASKRHYDSYDQYIDHQRGKLDRIAPRLEATVDAAFENFRNRFATCAELSGPIMCLGARLGTEVRALRSLGHFAVGIDLNPGPNNPFVMTGDFHNLQFPDNCVNCVYTNALDHVFDIPRFLCEIRRVLKPEGHLVIDGAVGYEEGLIAGKYEAIHWPKVEPFVRSIATENKFSVIRVTPIVGEPLWVQFVIRPDAPSEIP